MKARKAETKSTAAQPSVRDGSGGRGRTCVIAGGGTLPIDVANALAEAGERPYVLMVEGEADPVLSRHDGMRLPLGALTGQLRALKAMGIRNIVLAGTIRSRPPLSALRFDRSALSVLPRILTALFSLGGGDDKLLRAIVGGLESYGLRVIGAHEIVPDLIVSKGAAGKRAPRKRDVTDIRLAWRAAKAIGALDVGQGAVAVHGRVVALEGAEGTDAMLERVRALRGAGRIPAKPGGVLVKCAKPGQELRADLPAIGPPTVANAAAAGLSGIVVEEGRALIMERQRTVALADEKGIFIAGQSEEGLDDA